MTARSPRPRVLAEGKRARAAAPRRAAHAAPSAMLRPRSAMDVCGVLAQLADLHAQLGQAYGRLGVLHEVEPASDSAQESRVPLEDPPERALMGPVETTTGIGLRDLATDYLEDLELRVSQRHFVQVKSRLGKAIDAVGDGPAASVEPMAVLRFRNRLKRRGASDRTVDTYCLALKAMLAWAVEVGLLAANPLARIKPLSTKRSEKRYRRRALSDEEIARFLAVSRRDDEDNDARAATEGIDRVPQTPLWVFLLDTGARWNEARQITWRDVDFGQRLVVLRAENTKSRKRRVIPLTPALEAQLRMLKAAHDEDPRTERVLLSPEGCPYSRETTAARRIFRRVLFRAGIALVTEAGKLDIHALRHTFGSRLARNGVSLVKTQRLLGHSDPKLTEAVYTHLDVDDLRDAVEALG